MKQKIFKSLALFMTVVLVISTLQIMGGAEMKTVLAGDLIEIEDGDIDDLIGSGTPHQYLIAYTVKNLELPLFVEYDLYLPTTGFLDTIITWYSDTPGVMSNLGEVTTPETDTEVTLTATVSSGNYYHQKDYKVTVLSDKSNEDEAWKLASYFTDEPMDLSQEKFSMQNPFQGINILGGVSIKFNVKHTGEFSYRDNIIAFNDEYAKQSLSSAGRLYFTGSSYLGYNANYQLFDANVMNGSYGASKWTEGVDYISAVQETVVEIKLMPDGYAVYIDGVMAYDTESVENGTTYGENQMWDYEDVLYWLMYEATTLSLGSGNWWTDVFNGTISNLELYVEPYSWYYNYVDVESITLNKSSATIKKGDTLQLTAKISPSNATYPYVYWYSSNPAIATVDEDTGLVKGTGVGSARIYAVSLDGASAEMPITVTNPVTSVTLNKNKKTLVKGDTLTLKATIAPSNANKSVKWKSDNESVAKVNSSGKVTAKGVGTARIRATAADGTNKYAECIVTVKYANAKKVTVTAKNAVINDNTVYVVKGEKISIKGSVSPNTAKQKVTYKVTKGKDCVSIKNGVITSQKAGTATISVKSADGKAVRKITVKVIKKAKANKSLTLTSKKNASLKVGASSSITVKATKGTTSALTYTITSGKGIVTVDKYGIIKAKKAGTAVIKAKCGKQTVKVTVTVTK